MKKLLLSTLIIFAFIFANFPKNTDSHTGAPPDGEPQENAPLISSFPWYSAWKRPDGPPTVALQVGHWKNEELPQELEKLHGNTGTSAKGKSEWEINYQIAKETAKILRKYNISVEILPATVPPSYLSDVFVSIHADGSNDINKSGYKIAYPWRDFSGNSKKLVKNIAASYERETQLNFDDNITKNMRGYYAFSWWKYAHSIHPMTTAAIIETGFLTNPSDQTLLIQNPQTPANGIAIGIINYLLEIGLIT